MFVIPQRQGDLLSKNHSGVGSSRSLMSSKLERALLLQPKICIGFFLEFLFLIRHHFGMVKQQNQSSSSLIPAQKKNPLLSQKTCGIFTLSHLNSSTSGSYCSYLSEVASKSLVGAL